MAPMVPKKAAPDNVRSIRSGGHAGGRRSSKGYDPKTAEEHSGESAASRGSEAEFDVFAVDYGNLGYRSDRFYTRSVDKDGHGQKLNLRVPQGIDSQMYAAVQDIPEYRTIHDLIRDAVVHRLEYLQHHYERSAKAQMMLTRERARADRYERTQDSDEQNAMVEDLEATLGIFYARKDWLMMKEELEKANELVEFQMRGEFKKQAQQIIKRWVDMSVKEIRQAEKEVEES